MSNRQDPIDLAHIRRAARDGRLSSAQMRALREIIAALEAHDHEPENDTLRRSIYNARVFDTQLRLLLQRLDERPFTPAEFARLPPYLQTRLKTRFKNIAERFDKTLKAIEAEHSATTDQMPIFKCKKELDACLAASPSGTGRLWCQIAMATCLAATAYKMATGS